MTLEPGDLIMTGTPEGVGEIKSGDILEANLGNICFLKVKVKWFLENVLNPNLIA